MKLQNLAIILVIIILPITLILTAYTKTQIDTIAVQTLYQTKLKDATYDAVTAFQLNTVKNTYSTVSDSIRRDIEAAIQTFIGDLAKSMGRSGANAEYIKPYIPAIVFTLYDGFYIYAPSYNYTELDKIDAENVEVRNGYTVSGVRNTNAQDSKTTQQISTEEVRQDLYDKAQKNKKIGAYEHVLKPYIYYTVRYKSSINSNVDITVNYSLDNYVVIYGYDKEGKYFTKAGYLEIKQNKEEVEEKEVLTKCLPVTTITFTQNILNRSLIDNQAKLDVSIKEVEVTNDILRLDRLDNGYTYEQVNGSNTITLRNGITIPIIDKNKVQLDAYQIRNNPEIVRDYYNKNKYINGKLIGEYYSTGTYDLGWYIEHKSEDYYVEADSAKKYYEGRTDENGLKYEGAIDFTKWVNDNIGPFIKASDAEKSDGTKYGEFGDDYIFQINSNNDPSEMSAVFNQHKRAIIKESIQDNLSQAIASYSQNSEALRTTYNFRMPVLSELEWSQVLENPCMISFLQGFKAGTKIFNDYAIVPNTKTKDYVSPDSIYYINTEGGDGYYHKLSCNHLEDNNIVGYRNYDFDRQSYDYKVFTGYDENGNLLEDGTGPLTEDKTEYYYMHLFNNGVTKDAYQACYYCMVNSTTDGNAIDWRTNDKRLKAYYTAMAREKYNFYKTNEYLNDQQVKRMADSRIGDKITEADYGTPIEYSVTINGTKLSDWKIFYNDGKNVYIILDHVITDTSLIPSQMGVYQNGLGGISFESDVYNAWSRLMNRNFWSEFAGGPGGSGSATGGPTSEMWDKAKQYVDTTESFLTLRDRTIYIIGNGNNYRNIDIKDPSQKVGFRPVVKLNANVAFVKGGDKITMR